MNMVAGTSDDSLINSVIGEGTHFRGNLELRGLLRVDGDFTGTIHAAGKVIIGRSGRADCTINAATIVVGGAFRGAIYATERVIVLSSAIVIGIVQAPRLIAEEGVALVGEFRIYGAPQEVVESVKSDEQTRRRLFGRKRDPLDRGTENPVNNGAAAPKDRDSAVLRSELPRGAEAQ